MNEQLEVYKEICANIRESDNISFRLIGLVPTASTLVVASLTFAQQLVGEANLAPILLPVVIILLSIGGGLIVFGIFKWEMRNVQKCDSLISSAADAEASAGFGYQYKRWSQQESSWGKTRAEKLIYRVAIALWGIPILVALISLCRDVSHLW